MDEAANLIAPEIMGLDPVYIVSFPRSGHHALIGFLNKVSNFASNYCEYYSCTLHNGEAIPCPYAGKNTRLKRLKCGAGRRFLKNHDFNLSLPITPQSKYIVQYRHPFLSALSWYEMETAKNKDLPPWEIFFDQKLRLWQSFIEKWVVRYGDNRNVILVPYESLSSIARITEIATFSGAVMKPDLRKIKHNFKSRRVIERDNELIVRERTLLPLLKRAGVSPIFDVNK